VAIILGLVKREGLMSRIALGLTAGVVTLIFFSMDQIEALAYLHADNSAFNYSMIIVMFYILFVMNFIAGLKREYEVSLTYILFMSLYDLLTNGLVTIMFATLSFISLLIGLSASTAARKLGIMSQN
jgi:hypothetical protein